jgi:uncharacterized damage-inducible protein DinB
MSQGADDGPAGCWLQTVDDAFGHPWESVSAALEGLTEAEACWQPPAYASEPVERDWPLPGTIAWHVAHLAHCKRYYTRIIEARGSSGTPAVEPRSPLGALEDELTALREAHARQRAAVAALAPGDLAVEVGEQRRMSLAEFLAMTTRHDVWHAAQIAVVRRLHRTRDA